MKNTKFYKSARIINKKHPYVGREAFFVDVRPISLKEMGSSQARFCLIFRDTEANPDLIIHNPDDIEWLDDDVRRFAEEIPQACKYAKETQHK